MIDSKTLDELAQRFIKALPEGLDQISDNFGQNIKAAFSSALARADLVTREEFDVQSSVLARTREKLTKLERTVDELERRLEGRIAQDGNS